MRFHATKIYDWGGFVLFDKINAHHEVPDSRSIDTKYAQAHDRQTRSLMSAFSIFSVHMSAGISASLTPRPSVRQLKNHTP